MREMMPEGYRGVGGCLPSQSEQHGAWPGVDACLTLSGVCVWAMCILGSVLVVSLVCECVKTLPDGDLRLLVDRILDR